jgi:dihydroflavonol-4-reductase
MMNVLITGATGFIGSHLAEELHTKGHRIRCLVRKSSKLVWINHLPVEYVYGDLSDADFLRSAVNGMDYIYHLAGLTKAKTKKEYFDGNHIATRNLLEAVLAVKPPLKRFVYMSSQTAVGPSTEETPVDEQTPCHPITTYGLSKLEAEHECLRHVNTIPITIVRPPAVYGPRDKDVFEFFKAMNKGMQPMIGFNTKLVNLIHVTDLVKGTVLAGEHPSGIGQTYFISSERYYNWKEVGDVTAQIMKKSVLRLRIPEFAVYTIAAIAECFTLFSKKPALLNIEKARDIVQDAWICSIGKAKKELGYREEITLERGISETVNWYRNQGWLS